MRVSNKYGNRLNKRSNQLFELGIPEFHDVVVDLGNQSTAGVDEARQSEGIEKRGLGWFIKKSVSIALGGTWFGAAATIGSATCSVASWTIKNMPNWVTNVCNVIGVAGVLTNVFSGSGTLKDAWRYRETNGVSPGKQWLEMINAQFVARDGAYDHDWDKLLHDQQSSRMVDGKLFGWHYHDMYDGLAILPMAAFATVNETAAPYIATSLNGELKHIMTKMWMTANDTDASFVSASYPYVRISKLEARQSQVGPIACFGGEHPDCFKETGNTNGMAVYYGDNWYGQEWQFDAYEYDGCCMDDANAMYEAAMLSNTMSDHDAYRTCMCNQVDGQWVSTGALEFQRCHGGPAPGAGCQYNGYSGYDDCWASNCNGA